LPAHRDLLGPVADEAIVSELEPVAWATRLDALLAEPSRSRALGTRLLERARELWGGQASAQRWTTVLEAMGAGGTPAH
jgi:hypothetical protein